MNVLVIEPMKHPVEKEISNELESLQKEVGGYIECIYPFDDEVGLICNEEGKLERLPPNRGLWDKDGTLYDVICGTFFLCAAPPDEDTFRSLTEEQVRHYQERFARPEIFLLGPAGQLLVLPVEAAP